MNMLKIYNRIEEGEIIQDGINYMRTLNGHAIYLQIPLPATHKLRFGYYWGVNFNFHFCSYNQKKEQDAMREFSKI